MTHLQILTNSFHSALTRLVSHDAVDPDPVGVAVDPLELGTVYLVL